MTIQEAITDLNKCNTLDTEMAHVRADAILIQFLRENGYGEICDAWETIDKWYA